MAKEPKETKITDKKSFKEKDPSKYVDLEPTLSSHALVSEAKTKTLVLTFGRFSPPTIGHEKLVNKIISEASSRKADAAVYTSHTQDKKKNPLSYDDKISFMQTAFGNIVKKSSARTIIEVLKELDSKYDNVVVVVGADRVPEFSRLLNTYNGKEFKFANIDVISAGERDPDADDVTGMSASKMRALAAQKDLEGFKSGLPRKLKSKAEEVYNAVLKGMKLMEDFDDLNEESLEEKVSPIDYMTRKRRALTMKKYAGKIARARERAMKRRSNPEKLLRKARRRALDFLKKRLAGKRAYSDLSTSEKISVDKRAAKIPDAAIDRIARKQLNVVRKIEAERLSSLAHPKEDNSPRGINIKANEEFENFLENFYSDLASAGDQRQSLHSKSFHSMYKKEGAVKTDGRFRFFRRKVNESAEDLLSEIQGLMEEVESLYGEVEEGVNDPSIFKAVFLAGGPGSGKSFIVGKTALSALGMKVINSDDAFERALAKAGMTATPENIYSPKGQEIRGQAKALTSKKMELALNGRLGLVIDGTGKDYDKIVKQATKLKDIGYEVAMIFVNTDLDTAKNRNRMRSRSLPDDEVEMMWKGVQQNLGKFQNFFRQKMFIIDNSEGSNYEGAVLSTYRKISAWAKMPPAAPAAKEWIDKARTKTEGMHSDRARKQIENEKKADAARHKKIMAKAKDADENMMESSEYIKKIIKRESNHRKIADALKKFGERITDLPQEEHIDHAADIVKSLKLNFTPKELVALHNRVKNAKSFEKAYANVDAWESVDPANIAEAKMIPPIKHAKTTVPDFVEPLTPDIAAQVSKHNKHHLGIGLSLKQMIKHAIQSKDVDDDGDVDAEDRKAVGDGELVADPSFDRTKSNIAASKAMQKKYGKEMKHTKVGVAFESVEDQLDEAQKPLGKHIGTVNGYHIHDRGENVKDDKRFLAYANHYNWISHSGKTKSEVTKKSKALETSKPITPRTDHDDWKDDMKQRISSGEVRRAVMSRRGTRSEGVEDPAKREWGTPSLTKTYRDDTPGQEDMDINEKFSKFVEEDYYAGLSKSTVAKRKAHFNKGAKMDDNNPAAYKPAPGDARAKTKPSIHTKRFKAMYGEATELDESAEKSLKDKAEKTGISYGILKKVFDRGVAAWRTGHRPGTTPAQWGHARVNSFATGGKTRTTADADLWAKHKGK